MKKNLLFILLICMVAFISCNQEGRKEDDDLPSSLGKPGEMLVVIDTALWDSPVGKELRLIFRSAVPGLPEPEPFYSMQRVSPFQLNNFLKIHRNLLFVAAFDDNTPSSNRLKGFIAPDARERIAADPSLFYMINKNLNAKDQVVMYLFGQNRDQLLTNLRENSNEIREQFNKAELERVTRTLFSKDENRKLSQELSRRHDFTLRIPDRYKLAKEDDNFVWLRDYARIDKNILITYKPYTSQDQFSPENIIAWRDSIGREQIFGSGEKDTVSYMLTQTYVPVETRNVNFNNKFSVETRGLWMLKNETMGGSFISYTFVDEALKRIYYIEGFLYAPGTNKREHMREMEVILKSFTQKDEKNI
jgi:hypothetical protein